MVFALILGIILGVVAMIFALQNVTLIVVNFFGWHLQGSLALILMMGVLTGILIALLIVLPESITNYFRYKRLLKENANLEEELKRQKELTHFAKTNPPTEEDLRRIEEGATSI